MTRTGRNPRQKQIRQNHRSLDTNGNDEDAETLEDDCDNTYYEDESLRKMSPSAREAMVEQTLQITDR